MVMPFGDRRSWTLVDGDLAVVEPAEGFLSHLHAVERSPNTVKAYAHDLRDWFESSTSAGWCGRRCGWRMWAGSWRGFGFR